MPITQQQLMECSEKELDELHKTINEVSEKKRRERRVREKLLLEKSKLEDRLITLGIQLGCDHTWHMNDDESIYTCTKCKVVTD